MSHFWLGIVEKMNIDVMTWNLKIVVNFFVLCWGNERESCHLSSRQIVFTSLIYDHESLREFLIYEAVAQKIDL